MDKRFFVKPWLRLATCAVGLALIMVAVGCDPGGASRGPDSTEEGRIKSLLSSVGGAASAAAQNPEAFQMLFAAGAAPADSEAPRYAKCGFYSKGASISGDTATVEVEVETMEGELDELLQWTVVREGKSWKIKDAPLPDSI